MQGWEIRMRIHGLSALACLILAAIVTMVLSSLPSDGQGLDDAISIQSDRDSLRLVPGKEGHVNLNVTNSADVPLWVKLDFYYSEAGAHSTGTIAPDLFQLAPGGSRDVVVHVVSHADLWQNPERSDVLIGVYWGNNASDLELTRFAGLSSKRIDVIDNYMYHDAAIIIGIAVLVLGYILVRRRRHIMMSSEPAP